MLVGTDEGEARAIARKQAGVPGLYHLERHTQVGGGACGPVHFAERCVRGEQKTDTVTKMVVERGSIFEPEMRRQASGACGGTIDHGVGGRHLSYPLTPFLALGATTANAPRGLYRGRVDQQVGEYGVSVQQRFPLQIQTEIGYIGNHGAHLPSRSYVNLLNPATGTHPLPAFGQVDYKLSGNNANFSGLSAQINRQFSKGLLFGVNYLWSHSINDGSTGGGEQGYPQNVACRICERASSDQDIRSSFTASVVYQFGSSHGHASTLSGVAGALGCGWQVSSIDAARIGLPLNVTITRSAASLPDGNSLSPQRPNLVPGVSFIPASGRTPQHWINAAAFTLPANGTFGNTPRSLLRGPGTWQICLADNLCVPQLYSLIWGPLPYLISAFPLRTVLALLACTLPLLGSAPHHGA